jgi:enamine deaminase RidA (YjgF/YER057c/UK114 family)
MPVELLNPEGLPKPDVYRQVAVATGSRLVFVSGQVARDADGNAVGTGDLAAQVEQAMRNVATQSSPASSTLSWPPGPSRS